jgi:hypothetical protein
LDKVPISQAARSGDAYFEHTDNQIGEERNDEEADGPCVLKHMANRRLAPEPDHRFWNRPRCDN